MEAPLALTLPMLDIDIQNDVSLEAEKLAVLFASRIGQTKKNLTKESWRNLISELHNQAKLISHHYNFNFYRKAKLASTFGWALRDAGIDNKIVTRVSIGLLCHLWFRGNSQSVLAAQKESEVEAESLFNQGLEYFNHGNFEKAIIWFQKSLERYPDNAATHINLAVALLNSGRKDQAEYHSRRAVTLAPHNFDVHYFWGKSLFERHYFADAASNLWQAVTLNPGHADAFIHLGMSHLYLGNAEDAESCYQRVLDIQPDNVDALVSLGNLVCTKGEYDKSNSYFQRALAIVPKYPPAWAGLVGLRKMTLDDSAWLSTAKEIVKGGLQGIQESTLQFSMGKFCDDTKDYNQAFMHYSRANKLLKDASPQFDGARLTQFFNKMIQSYTKKRISELSVGASASRRPVFIVGMARSGTSLIEQILASHPAVFGAGEFLFWDFAFSKHEKAVLEGELGESLLNELANDYLQALSLFSNDAVCVVNKTPGNFVFLGLIHSVFPNARIIHATRHPIDTCLSNYFQSFAGNYNYTNDLENLAYYYREYHRLMKHWREVLPTEILLDVPYESLVDNQEVWSRKFVDFLDLDWDDRCLNFHKTKRRVMTTSHLQVRQPLYNGSVDRWRNYEKFIAPLKTLVDLR